MNCFQNFTSRNISKHFKASEEESEPETSPIYVLLTVCPTHRVIPVLNVSSKPFTQVRWPRWLGCSKSGPTYKTPLILRSLFHLMEVLLEERLWGWVIHIWERYVQLSRYNVGCQIQRWSAQLIPQLPFCWLFLKSSKPFLWMIPHWTIHLWLASSKCFKFYATCLIIIIRTERIAGQERGLMSMNEIWSQSHSGLHPSRASGLSIKDKKMLE